MNTNEENPSTEAALSRCYRLLAAIADASGRSVYFFDDLGEAVNFAEFPSNDHICGELTRNDVEWKRVFDSKDDLERADIRCPRCGKIYEAFKMGGLIARGRPATAYVRNDSRAVKRQSDPDEGFLNAETGRERMHEMIRRNETFSIVLIDSDGFLPPLVEDETSFTEIVRETLRANDDVYKFEDDKFLMILPGCSHFKAVEVMNRVQKRLEYRGDERRSRFSLGISEFRPEKPLAHEDMIDEADRALYRAKTNRRMRR